MSLLKVQNLTSGYGPIEVLHDISLTVEPGEIVAIIGANGSGKTSTLLTISGCVKAKKGSISFQDKDITRLATHEIVKRGIAHSPEGRKIFPRLTVLENLQMGAFTCNNPIEIHEDIEKAYAYFPILKSRRHQLGGTLSGGEQQMLAIARALMIRPNLLILDEPSLGLAPLIVKQIFEVIQELNQQKMSILLVEQNAKQALSIAHRAYVLETGVVTMCDDARKLLNDPRIREAYLGH
jgi:branched-chain amino acid transport system ATP-binding protein